MTPGWPCTVSITESITEFNDRGADPQFMVLGIDVLCDGEYLGTTDSRGWLMFSLDAKPGRITLDPKDLTDWKVVERMGMTGSGEPKGSGQRSSYAGFTLERR